MKLSIAGPMTGLPSWNYPLFHAAAGMLRDQGFEIFNPAEIPGDPETLVRESCMLLDLAFIILLADGVIVLPRWRESQGATQEVRTAASIGIPVFSFAAWVDSGCLVPEELPADLLASAWTPAPILTVDSWGTDGSSPVQYSASAAAIGALIDQAAEIDTLLGDYFPAAPARDLLTMGTELPLIGVTGHKGAGKDTVAAILVREFGYERTAFADALRREVFEAAGSEDENYEEWSTYVEAHKHDDPASPAGWTRLIHQAWGQMQRDLEGDQYWIDQADLVPGVVVSDVRYPNEAAAIKDAGGIVLRVNRPGCAGDSHASEVFVDTIMADATIDNSGSLSGLYLQVMDIMETLLATHADAIANPK